MKNIEKVKQMTFASIFPMYVAKIEKKGQKISDLYEIIFWLTNFDKNKIDEIIAENWNLEKFFENAKIHKNANLIKGTICGYKIEEIEDEFMKKVRYLDKIVDELAKGKTPEKICRK